MNMRSLFYDINDEENSNDLDIILKEVLVSYGTVNVKYKNNYFYFNTWQSRDFGYKAFMKNIKSYYFNKGHLSHDLQNPIFLYLLLKNDIKRVDYRYHNPNIVANIVITSEELYSFLLIKYTLGGCNESES